jgi:probable F420-dependent oxidoreductase
MKFGFSVPISGPAASPAIMARLAQEGESIGYDYVTISDHVVEPTDIQARYPYSETGEFPKTSTGDRHEQLTAVAYLAAKTSKIQFLTSVMVVPHRPAVLAAKVLSTIDVLSGGRLMLGIGAGWMKEEFEAVGAPAFEERGRVTDEYLQAFKLLWTEDEPRFAGRHVGFENVSFLPKPVQKPHPPIWVGGESPAALRRTARHGDTWFPIGNNPRHPLDTVPRFQEGLRSLHHMAEQNGRDPSSVGLAYYAGWFDQTKTIQLDNGERHLMTGSAAQIAEDIDALGELGVTDLVLNLQRGTLDQSLESMQHFVDEIRPLMR